MGKFDSYLGTQKMLCPRIFKLPYHALPTLGWFDGATQSNGLQSGAGGVIKLFDNTIYKWNIQCGPGTNTRVELLGVWETLILDTRVDIDTL